MRETKRKAKKNKTMVMYESLEYMQMSCRHCLVGAEWGYWHCECEEDRWDHGEKDDEDAHPMPNFSILQKGDNAYT